tara:strand:- start:4317 stop:5396 length:1080 start_codon:yes stop_codon:yes gene_type:complete
MIKTYQKYIFKDFLKSIFFISGIFYALVLILNIFEEMNYVKNLEVDLYLPFLLNFLNSPSLLYNIFPFIFLIATQFFFINLIEKNELLIFKNIGLDNYKIIKLLAATSLVSGVLIVLFFYNLSAIFKFTYLDLKNNYANDNRYLAVITENGLWIRDEIDGNINIINAEQINNNYLENVIITQFDYSFNITKYISSKKIDIRNNNWILNKPKISITGKQSFNKDTLELKTNFNSEKINTLFSNMESLTTWQLLKQKKDYEEVGYSVDDINLHLQKIYSFPIYLMITTILSSVIMLNIKHNKPKIFYLLLGILLSVIIFYISHFANTLGVNNKIPIILSVWLPLLIISILVGIGLVTINEK